MPQQHVISFIITSSPTLSDDDLNTNLHADTLFYYWLCCQSSSDNMENLRTDPQQTSCQLS